MFGKSSETLHWKFKVLIFHIIQDIYTQLMYFINDEMFSGKQKNVKSSSCIAHKRTSLSGRKYILVLYYLSMRCYYELY